MPCPPPQSALSKERSRSRLAVSENIELLRSSSARLTAARSASGVMAPLWQASVSSTFHFALMRAPITEPSVSMEYPVPAMLPGSRS